MVKKRNTLHESEMRKHVKDIVEEVLYEEQQRTLLTEMATMNGNDHSGEFPINSAIIEVRSNDHAPRHIHLIKRGCYELKFLIDTGEFLEEKWANDRYSVSALTKQVKKWLHQPSSFKDSFNLTNQQMCIILWNIYHPSDK